MYDYVKTIKWYQDQCHDAMTGDWKTMTEQEMERRITQWQENMMLQ